MIGGDIAYGITAGFDGRPIGVQMGGAGEKATYADDGHGFGRDRADESPRVGSVGHVMCYPCRLINIQQVWNINALSPAGGRMAIAVSMAAQNSRFVKHRSDREDQLC